MSDEQEQRKRSLSEISHLFLSNVRDRHMAGTTRPSRIPPRKSAVSIDLTPEEFAMQSDRVCNAPAHAPPVAALLTEHLNGHAAEGVRQYARGLTAKTGRVGLIELAGAELHLLCFDPSGAISESVAPPADMSQDPRHMIEALAELNQDVNQWLLVVNGVRSPEARALLRRACQWVLLSTCDHDGIVGAYRTIKGLLSAGNDHPPVRLALLNTRSDSECARVNEKLASVCRQFLNVPLEFEGRVVDSINVTEHRVLAFGSTHDKAQLAAAPHWDVVANFVEEARSAWAASRAARAAEPVREHEPVEPAEEAALMAEPLQVAGPRRQVVEEVVVPPQPVPASMLNQTDAAPTLTNPVTTAQPQGAKMLEVLELPGGDDSPEGLLNAVLRQPDAGLIEFPIRPPSCPQARLAITRQRAVVLLATADKGLGNLRGVGQAYRWLMENRSLIAMALPQMALDTTQPPVLRLIVDRSDLSADLLSPMLQSSNVSVQTFRRLRWGEKTGLLLEAA